MKFHSNSPEMSIVEYIYSCPNLNVMRHILKWVNSFQKGKRVQDVLQ